MRIESARNTIKTTPEIDVCILKVDHNTALRADRSIRRKGYLPKIIIDSVIVIGSAFEFLAVEPDSLGSRENLYRGFAFDGERIRPLVTFRTVELVRRPDTFEYRSDSFCGSRVGIDLDLNTGKTPAVAREFSAESELCGKIPESRREMRSGNADIDLVELGDFLRCALGLNRQILVAENRRYLDILSDTAVGLELKRGFHSRVTAATYLNSTKQAAGMHKPAALGEHTEVFARCRYGGELSTGTTRDAALNRGWQSKFDIAIRNQ
ncbi:hypothetical protein DRQ36_09590 [bacterium]|nr:MAG: hypothetical protein DRQ36_09590 [bacterium]